MTIPVMNLSIQIPAAPTAFRSWDEISTPMAPRAFVETPSPIHRNTYLAEYCYDCDREFNFLRCEYVLNDRTFCSRRCFNRFQNALCDVCERHPCACQDDVSAISDASSTSIDDEDEDDGYPDLLVVRDDQLPVNLAFIDFEHYDEESAESAEQEQEQEQDYENYDEDDCEDPDDQVAPWRP